MIDDRPEFETLPPKATITLRENATGKTIVVHEDWTRYSWYKDQNATLHNVWWQWSHGNFSCDCNRHLSFGHDIDHDISCGDEEVGGNKYDLIGFEPA